MAGQGVSRPSQPGGATTMRDAEFWFDDGTVVLVACDIGFRIYKGILTKNSPVFHDMFSFPQPQASTSPPSLSAAADPCPIVYLPDSPEDLRHILRVCMPNSGSSSAFNLNNPSFHMVSAVVRLGHKYQMNDLVADAVSYLKRYYPSILDEWALGRLYTPEVPFERVHAIGVVNLARLVNEPLLLPTALLMCCTLDKDITRGFVREDGTRETLSLDDIGQCFAARTQLTKQMILILFYIFEPNVSIECAEPSECRAGLESMLHNARVALRKVADPDVFRPFVRAFGPSLVCASCQDMLRARDVDARSLYWITLPAIFDLPLGPGQWPGKSPAPKVLTPEDVDEFWAEYDSDGSE